MESPPSKDTVVTDTMSPQTDRPVSERNMAFIREGDIWIASADGSNARTLITGYEPEISPDGKSVAFTEYGKNGGRFIAIADLATSAVRRMRSVPGDNSYGPRWSPDGSRLAFHHHTESQWKIGVVDADDAHFIILNAPVPGAPFLTLSSLCWARAGQAMICQDLAGAYEFGLDGALHSSMSVRQFLGADTLDYDFSSANTFNLDGDGRLLVFDADNGETMTSSVFVYDRRTKTSRMISPRTYHAHAPAWLADGRTIVFSGFELTENNRARALADQPVKTSIYTIDLDGSNLQELVRNAEAPSVSR